MEEEGGEDLRSSMIRGRRGAPEKLHDEGEVVVSPPDILRPPPAPGGSKISLPTIFIFQSAVAGFL